MSIVDEQHAPKPEDKSKPAVWDLVMRDFLAWGRLRQMHTGMSQGEVGDCIAVVRDAQDRDTLGRRRYGTPLQPFNGRDAITDAYQEALDGLVYLRQARYERDTPALACLFELMMLIVLELRREVTARLPLALTPPLPERPDALTALAESLPPLPAWPATTAWARLTETEAAIENHDAAYHEAQQRRRALLAFATRPRGAASPGPEAPPPVTEPEDARE